MYETSKYVNLYKVGMFLRSFHDDSDFSLHKISLLTNSKSANYAYFVYLKYSKTYFIDQSLFTVGPIIVFCLKWLDKFDGDLIFKAIIGNP